LKDSMILWSAADNTLVQSTAFEDGVLMLEQRSLQAFPGKKAVKSSLASVKKFRCCTKREETPWVFCVESHSSSS
jgi:hypothetical protein